MPSRASSPSVSSESVASRQSTPTDLSLAEIAKEGLIITACEESDLPTLVHLATSPHGLVSDNLRRTAWPILLACKAPDRSKIPWQDLPEHREEGQVGLDVNRAFVYYPKCSMCKAGTSSEALKAHYNRLRKRARSPEAGALERNSRGAASTPSAVLLSGLSRHRPSLLPRLRYPCRSPSSSSPQLATDQRLHALVPRPCDSPARTPTSTPSRGRPSAL